MGGRLTAQHNQDVSTFSTKDGVFAANLFTKNIEGIAGVTYLVAPNSRVGLVPLHFTNFVAARAYVDVIDIETCNVDLEHQKVSPLCAVAVGS